MVDSMNRMLDSDPVVSQENYLHFSAESGFIQWDFWFNSGMQNANRKLQIALNTADTTGFGPYFQFVGGMTGWYIMQYNNGATWIDIVPQNYLGTDIWHHARVLGNTDTDVYDLYLDNMSTSYATGLPFASDVSDLDYLYVAGAGSGLPVRTMRFDDISVVPEPATLGLLLLGGLALLRRRRS